MIMVKKSPLTVHRVTLTMKDGVCAVPLLDHVGKLSKSASNGFINAKYSENH